MTYFLLYRSAELLKFRLQQEEADREIQHFKEEKLQKRMETEYQKKQVCCNISYL